MVRTQCSRWGGLTIKSRELSSSQIMNNLANYIKKQGIFRLSLQ